MPTDVYMPRLVYLGQTIVAIGPHAIIQGVGQKYRHAAVRVVNVASRLRPKVRHLRAHNAYVRMYVYLCVCARMCMRVYVSLSTTEIMTLDMYTCALYMCVCVHIHIMRG